MRILWSLKWENVSWKVKGILQICVWQQLLKSFKNVRERVKSWKKLKCTPFKGHLKGFHLSCKTVSMLRNSFTLKHHSMTTVNFWNYCGQSLAGLCLLKEVRYRYQKKRSDNIIEYFFTVKTEWPNMRAPKIFFNDFRLQHILR